MSRKDNNNNNNIIMNGYILTLLFLLITKYIKNNRIPLTLLITTDVCIFHTNGFTRVCDCFI